MGGESESYDRLQLYCTSYNREVEVRLGTGTQGTVFVLESLRHPRRVAVKFHDRKAAYQRERDTYLRLLELDVQEVCGHRVPILLHHDDEFLALEMTIVSPPFCLDFGGAYLDRPPDYSAQTWADWEDEKREAFEDDWPAVEEILAEFRLMKIFIADVNPGNIRFRNP
ncbi:MAG: hypothetical protein AAFU85_29850 [Planctomycetota bacterium]